MRVEGEKSILDMSEVVWEKYGGTALYPDKIDFYILYLPSNIRGGRGT
jgi:hypothetical protein